MGWYNESSIMSYSDSALLQEVCRRWGLRVETVFGVTYLCGNGKALETYVPLDTDCFDNSAIGRDVTRKWSP